MRIIVLGSGLVGSAIIKDLTRHSNHAITACDFNPSRLSKFENSSIETVSRDLKDKRQLRELISDFDLVIGALTGSLGYQTIKTVIEENKDIVDISFFKEDPFTLHQLALKNEVKAIIDCGLSPGLSNIILGYATTKLDKIESFKCYVGGLPVVRSHPFEYKAPFSPQDVFEVYTRPARIQKNGKLVVKPALSEKELIEFPELGTLEAFNTDGLRTLLKTMGNQIPNMVEKTLRYPGHIDKITMLKTAGFFSHALIEISEQTTVKPFDVTSKILSKNWEMKEGDKDITVMRIIITGIKNKKPIQYQYDLVDYFDEATGLSSMARTTGFTCSIISEFQVSKQISEYGIIPPEIIGQQKKLFKNLMNELRRRNVIIKESITA